MRNSIIFYRSFYEAINELPEDMQVKVYSAIFEYSLNYNEVVLTGLPKSIFTLIKPQLDANNKRFENGKKGGAKIGNENAKKQPKNNQETTKSEPKINQKTIEKLPKNNQTETEKQPNNNVNVNENVNYNENENENENVLLEKETKDDFFPDKQKEIFPEQLNPEKIPKEKSCAKKERFTIPSLVEVQNYCNERQNGVSAYKFINFYQSKDWMIGKNKMKDWKAAVRTWENDKPKSTNQSKVHIA